MSQTFLVYLHIARLRSPAVCHIYFLCIYTEHTAEAEADQQYVTTFFVYLHYESIKEKPPVSCMSLHFFVYLH